MTEHEFWQAVGELLAERRMRKGLGPASIKRPTNKTVSEIEAGRIGRVSALREYIQALGLDMVDVFRTALNVRDEPYGPELEFVIRQFKNSGVTGRAALVSTARLAEERVEHLPSSPHDRDETHPETPRAEALTAKRHAKK